MEELLETEFSDPRMTALERVSSSSERMLLKDYDRKGSVEKISGLNSQGA
jgi:hypothetical protein